MFFFLIFVDPDFKEPISNVTASVGREAVLSCAVQDLAGYKVSFSVSQEIYVVSIYIVMKTLLFM